MEIPQEQIDRFWSKVLVGDARECWPWRGGRTVKGYGRFRMVGFPSRRAHRIAWGLKHGGGNEPLPGLFVLHRCDFPPCCNPSHLYLGNHEQNMEDKVQKARRAKGMHQLRVDISRSLHERLINLAILEQRPKAEMIREALEDLVGKDV